MTFAEIIQEKYGRQPMPEPSAYEMAIAEEVGRSVVRSAFSKYRDAPAPVEAPVAPVKPNAAPWPGEGPKASIGKISRKPRVATWQRLKAGREYKAKLRKRPCTIEGCKDGQRCKQMCNKHYKQWEKGTLIVPEVPKPASLQSNLPPVPEAK